ncbi:MAG: lipoyl(octanoyl) transferase [Epsilonproteobacteria bacterium]|nr:MAG: lipoyl(octanoyl) transferase [Campylobacterota bacterium]RLA68104.1 MAG: lipoyl(octanoyl) transferase [Campylobacterota bacterium]
METSIELVKKDLKLVGEDIAFIEKWDWDYLEAHEFQKAALELVRQNPKLSIFIFCSHPHCLTLGRGLQKSKDPSFTSLIDFDPRLKERLDIPLHEIKRGGGLTFHYPGQWVLYPIINLNRSGKDVYKVMNGILEITTDVLKDYFKIENLSYTEKMLGLWHGDKKLASIGLAVSHFVTYHGMALNILQDPRMKKSLELINPCGLPGSTYVELESITSHEETFKTFHHAFKEKLLQSPLFN